MLKTVMLKFHSMVDVITNSSSVTYTGANQGTVKNFKKFLAVILKGARLANPDPDKYFDVWLAVDPDDKDRIEEDALAADWDKARIKTLLETKARTEDEIARLFAELGVLHDGDYEYRLGIPPVTLVVAPKKSETSTDVLTLFSNLFDSESGRDG